MNEVVTRTLTAGALRGQAQGGVEVYRGIPYATAERFSPPVPATWTGTLDALDFGPIAPQVAGAQFQRVELNQDEQCLSLNVWTSGDGADPRPVMVWVHGGAFRTGSGASPLYDGRSLVERGDVVVITLNYRLGALGFLAHPSLGGEGEPQGSWGMLDVVEALRWVQANVAHFGGDPDEVTVFGESAGAAAVSLLLTMPAASGLFRRAIVQSGAPLTTSMAVGEALAERLVAAAGVATVDDLRTIPVHDLLTAQAKVEAGGLERTFVPVVDGVVLPDLPTRALAAGCAAGIPTLIGSNRDEWKLWAPADPRSRDLDASGLQRRLARVLPEGAVDAVIDAVAAARAARGEPTAPNELYFAIESERTFRVHAVRLADAQAAHAPTFVYLFDWESPAMRGWLGACHGLEIAFAFGTQGQGELAAFTGSGPEADALAEQMMDAWLAFARTGDPSTPERPWPRHDPATRPTMVLGRTTRVEAAPRDEERAAVDAALPHA
jgi:para-nitrobenzyl esterase